MADESKFSGLFDDRLKTPPPQQPGRTEKSQPTPPPKPAARATGKRSDPNYKQFSVLLRKDTHKQAARLLDDLENGQDVSDLVQQLLEQWVTKQNKKAS